MALAPNATQITVREVIAKIEAEFTAVGRALENGEFALWVGSGISRHAPDLGMLIARAVEYLRARAIDPATATAYLPALREAIELGGHDPATLAHRFAEPFSTWPEHVAIVQTAWNNYSRVLDIRVPGETSDFILWNAIDIREAFANPAPPAAQHLCIAILILEGAVRTIASANWDGFIEVAVERLSNGLAGVLQVVVDPNQMREPPGRAQLLKFHGCIRYATQEPHVFRQYLTGSRTQIMEWPEAAQFIAMCNAVVNVATNQKALVLGLSIQDNNLQGVFTRAKQVNPWPWPCAPQAPAHVFCEDEIKQGQRDVLRIVYGEAYNNYVADIQASSHLRAWAEQVLIALVLMLLANKLSGFMTLFLDGAGKRGMAASLAASLNGLRDAIADLAVIDAAEKNRTRVTDKGIAVWSRMLSIFRTGSLPAAPEAYEALSALPLNLIAGDANAHATGLGRLAVGLALLQHGIATGHWKLGAPTGPEPVAGALRATATHAGAIERPVFLVKSATEAIALQSKGAFANDNAFVVHGEDTWHQMVSASGSPRRVRGAPGRTGRVGTTHISLGYLVEQCDNADALQQLFVAEMIL